MNSLPDLSTVDIQAIQDTEPLNLPRLQLPPLTTIAENWQDTIEPVPRNPSCSHVENETNSFSDNDEDSDDDEDEEPNSLGKSKKQSHKSSSPHSNRLSSTSSSSSIGDDSLSDCSDSEGTESSATSDSDDSSSTTSEDSDVSTCSSSTSSIRSRCSKSAANAIITNNQRQQTSFSVREANYDQGRVTLRLSSLQLARISGEQESESSVLAPSKCKDVKTITPFTSPVAPTSDTNTESQKVTALPASASSSRKEKVPQANSSLLNQTASSQIQKVVTPIKIRRRSNQGTCISSAKPDSSVSHSDTMANGSSPNKPWPNEKGADQSSIGHQGPKTSLRKTSPVPVNSNSKCKLRPATRNRLAKEISAEKASAKPSAKVSLDKSGTGSSTSESPMNATQPASRLGAAALGPSMLSDIESDSDELYLPAVSEAIRMLDLDSPPAAQTNNNSPDNSLQLLPTVKTGSLKVGDHSSAFHKTGEAGPNRSSLLNLCGPANSAGVRGGSWPAVGYCSSLLQQFVAKSQSGEPPPPPPPPLQLTKGARKCFSLLDEPPSTSTVCGSVVGPATATSAGDRSKPVGGEQETLCEVLVPMRGLDCHPSHVSPDSGIQSVSGSPFSVHSSPVHPGAHNNSGTVGGSGGGGGISLAQAAQQQHTLVISPCPPAATPSPPPAKLRRKRAKVQVAQQTSSSPSSKAKTAAAPARSSRSSSRSSNRSSNRSQSVRRRSVHRRTARRPRPSRDSVTALTSGLSRESSFAQAIQRGLSDALRLTGMQNCAPAARGVKEVVNRPQTKRKDGDWQEAKGGVNSGTAAPAKQEKRKREMTNTKTNGRKRDAAAAPAPKIQKDPSAFRNEIAAQLHYLISKNHLSESVEGKPSETANPSRPGSTDATATCHSNREKRKKKKKKKHKKDLAAHEVATGTASTGASAVADPAVLQGLEVLCKSLSRCVISRISPAVVGGPQGSVRLPYVFQCKKYGGPLGGGGSGGAGVVGGSVGGVGGGHKRKKVDDEAASLVVTGGKRKNKNKKIGSPLPDVHPTGAAIHGGSSARDKEVSEMATAGISGGATGAAGELLLPLKKRHHHLAAESSAVASSQRDSDGAASTQASPVKSTSPDEGDGKELPAKEKPSHEPVQLRSLPTASPIPVPSSEQLSVGRKRSAVNDSVDESPNETSADESARSLKKLRSRKKSPVAGVTAASLLPRQDPASQRVKAPAAAAPVTTAPAVIFTAEPSACSPIQPRKVRRRKTFNRTGFPSVKKKRKKTTSSPVVKNDALAAGARGPEAESPRQEYRSEGADSGRIPPTTATVDVSQVPSATRSSRTKRSRPERQASAGSRDSESDTHTADSVPSQTRAKTAGAGNTRESLPVDSATNFGGASKVSLTSAASCAAHPAAGEPKKRQKRVPSWRKRYLTAGLFSNFFKQEESPSCGSVSTSNGSGAANRIPSYDPEEHEHGLLPPPFHCEKWLRRRRQDFQLPYDLWWLHQHGKLPGRDTMVPSWNYRKIRTNVYYDVKPPYSNDAQACDCKPPAPGSENEKNPDAYCGDDCLNRMVYTECSTQLCPLAERCNNTRIQRHAWAQGLERFMTKEKGWGVRCRSQLKAGQFILEYVGEVVSEKEFKQRMNTVYVHDTHHYCLHLDGGLVIDGHRMGGDGRFVNHSCAPNCEMQKWSVNGLPRMALFSLRDIPPYEELSYDYNFSLFNPAEGQPCKCGSAQCRGVIGGKWQRVNLSDQGGKSRGRPTLQQLQQDKRKRKRHQQEKAPGLGPNPATQATATLKPLSAQIRGFVLQHRCFLVRNLERVRQCREREKERLRMVHNQPTSRTRRLLQKVGSRVDSPAVNQAASIILTSVSVSSATAPEPGSWEKAATAIAAGVESVPVKSVETFPPALEEDFADEEVVRCHCRLFLDEGLMVQCEKCETWQHSDCLGPEKSKAAQADEHYTCDGCLGKAIRNEDVDIVLVPQPDNPPEGTVFYLSLHYKDLQVRQGDCVYVLRDHDTPDSKHTLWQDPSANSRSPMPRPPRPQPANSRVKVSDMDIFQVERIWVDETGKKFVYGHHFLRPHETFHEPSRKFYVNEVLHVPIYEQIPMWAVAGRCWVLDPTTFCKGRPVDAVEEHVYICEYRVDKTARLFAKVSRNKFPLCTKRFAFKTFLNRLKPQRTYQPHGPPATTGNTTRSRESPQPTAIELPSKGDRRRREKSKDVVATLSEPALVPATPKRQLATKVEPKGDARRLRLERLLCPLLLKKQSNEVEDASYLLERRDTGVGDRKEPESGGRGRGRGRRRKT